METLERNVVVLLLYLTSQDFFQPPNASWVCCQKCVFPCQCPTAVSTCPKGASLILDGCGCCRICARQKGQACSDVLVCDKQQGLQCDYSASFPGEPGECVVQEELGCEMNGVSYKEGEVFQLPCTASCHCSGGGVTCVPLCGEDIRLPTPDCPNPQRVQLPGKCCKEWVCEDMNNSVLQDVQTAYGPERLWPGYSPNHSSNCVEQSSEWSACSRTCGPGISTRLTNQNAACRMEKQIRFCNVRPCQTFHYRNPMWPRRCKPSYRPAFPVRLLHQGCYSTRLYRPRYCGLCTDGRCCTPHHTQTVSILFRCRGGLLLQHAVMMISSCICHYSCPNSPGSTSYRNLAFWG